MVEEEHFDFCGSPATERIRLEWESGCTGRVERRRGERKVVNSSWVGANEGCAVVTVFWPLCVKARAVLFDSGR